MEANGGMQAGWTALYMHDGHEGCHVPRSIRARPAHRSSVALDGGPLGQGVGVAEVKRHLDPDVGRAPALLVEPLCRA